MIVGLAARALVGAFISVAPAVAGEKHDLAALLCKALATAVDVQSRQGSPVLLVSYLAGPGESELEPSLRQSAFTYDNALAAIAMTACGDVARARRIGDALLNAIGNDRHFRDGRIRNAYRSGPMVNDTPALPGWWDARQNLWAEDAYQDGSATGNVAWAALALLTLGDATQELKYQAGAERMLGWITAKTYDERSPAGYSGGMHGFDPQQTKLFWKSTEHNLDIHAVATWLYRTTGKPAHAQAAAVTREFLESMFEAESGSFRLGTKPDGSLQSAARVALDTQLWPLLGVINAPASWQETMAFAYRTMAVHGGFDFNEDRDGLWVEGTAQAALTLRALSRPDEAFALLEGLAGHVSASGFLFATREPRVTTGLAIGPTSTTDDLFYYRRPHLGATAWGVLAALGWNPFTGRSVD